MISNSTLPFKKAAIKSIGARKSQQKQIMTTAKTSKMAAKNETNQISKMSTAERFEKYQSCVNSRVNEISSLKGTHKGEFVRNKALGSEAEAKMHCQAKYMSQFKEQGTPAAN